MMLHSFGLLYPSNRTTFYIDNPARVGLARNHAPFDAGGGVELWRKLPPQQSPNSVPFRAELTTPRHLLARRRILHLAPPDGQFALLKRRHHYWRFRQAWIDD